MPQSVVHFLGTQQLRAIPFETPQIYMGGCQNYGSFLDPYYNTAPNISGTPKKGPNFDNHPYEGLQGNSRGHSVTGLGSRVRDDSKRLLCCSEDYLKKRGKVEC